MNEIMSDKLNLRPTQRGSFGVAVKLGFGLVLGGCAGASELVLAPDPSVGPEFIGSELADSGGLAVGGSADQAALIELRDLQYRSLAKGADRVFGVLPTPDPEEASLTDWNPPNRSRGGASAAPRYDFDVESFAEHRRVQYYVDFFRDKSRDRFNIWLGRMARWEGMIYSVLREYDLPDDLIYLALIESGYSTTAVSRASAVGMWQFIRSTGREYGLRIDGWVDERRDPFKATDAAARHLVDLREQFGSWYLAAAAYNGGAGRVSRGLTRLAGDSVTDESFFALADRRWLRRETRDYVPKLIAATMVAENPLEYGFDSIPVLEPLVFDEVTVSGQTGIDVVAGLADTTLGAIRELNPQYYRNVTPPGESATIRVPRGMGNVVAQRYAELPVEDRVNFLEHFVRKGETLSQIAQRYRVGLSFLRVANPRVQPRRLSIGQRLVVPVSTSARIGQRRPIPREAPASGLHVVRPGDTLWVVAQRYGVGVSDLRKWNNMAADETLLRVSQRLTVVGR